jgi:NAD(P)-dependent dehydrogenase (short-subunit alcohol dehydrogenase family)
MGLTEKRLVVVGGSFGMGLAIANAVMAERADVTIVGRSMSKLNPHRADVITDSRNEKETRVQQMMQRLPARRSAKPEDITQAVLPLMQNGYITGAVLPVDGGQRLI